MIANQIQRALTGFYWKVWENKWILNCDLNEEADGERQNIPGYGTLIGERSLA